ncbi:MAG: TIGR02679 family protein [Pseudonocardiales bacterium]|nr:MAG: TIGR02679 family protein [Pseudonocardiales bacterium]
MTAWDPALPDWLADPALAPIWRRLRPPLERGARTTRLTALDRPTRHALSGVLGRPVTGDLTLVLADLDTLLQERARISLVAIVEAATGELRDRDGERAARLAPVERLARVDPAWAERVRGSGLLARVADPVALVEQAIAVRDQLPGPTRLRAELAAAVTGDAHALDDGRPLAALVLRGLVDVIPASTGERREVWERAGVLADTVSTSVLTLGLHPAGDGARQRALRSAADLGDPVHITPWLLRRLDGPLAARPVLVVENPAVLEAFAVRHGGRHPIVCTAGWPSLVAVDLLGRLGVPLSYHGDFDWRGVEICQWLRQRVGAVPWLMTERDYRAAPGGGPLNGRPAPTPWEPDLAGAMAECGVAVHEEQVVDVLLETWPA